MENNHLSQAQGERKRAYAYSGFSPSNHNILCSGLPQKVPPYNTGKVLIGSAYHPQPKYKTSVVEDRLQAALLAERQGHQARADRWFMRSLYVIGVVGLAIVVATA